jgi:hypothetical protein
MCLEKRAFYRAVSGWLSRFEDYFQGLCSKNYLGQFLLLLMFVPKIASEEVVTNKSKTYSEIDVEVKISKPDYFLSQSKS